MHHSDAPSKAAGNRAADSHRRDVRRIPRRWRTPVRVVWLLLVLLSISLFFASLPAFYDGQLQWASEPIVRPNLASFGLSPEGYSMLQVVLRSISVVVFCAVGLVIFWRAPDEWIALFVAFLLVTITAGPEQAWNDSLPFPWWLPGGLLRLFVFPCAPLFFFLFPDGRFVPRWTRWVAVVWIGSLLFEIFSVALLPPPSAAVQSWFRVLRPLMLFGMLSSFAFAPIYRYRRVAGPLQRQQVKWVVFGVAATIVPLVMVGLLSLVFPAILAPGTLFFVVGQAFLQLAALSIPLSIGVAVLRYRLWDVDPILNRLLVYGVLTAILVLVYVGSVVALQYLFRTLTGQQSDLAIVASTLAIAALFQPLRRRIQNMIDRRFYRRKYDAQKTLAAFSAKMREETDLNQLTDDMLSVVQETLQPAHVSLWMNPAANRERGFPTAALSTGGAQEVDS